MPYFALFGGKMGIFMWNLSELEGICYKFNILVRNLNSLQRKEKSRRETNILVNNYISCSEIKFLCKEI